MNKKHLFIVVIVIVLALLVWGIPRLKKDGETAGRETQDEFVIFDGFQGLTSISLYDGDDDTITVNGGHGLIVGDVIMFNTASALDSGAFSEATKYFVVTASSSTILKVSETKGGTAVDIGANASAGGGEFYTREFPSMQFSVGNYEHIMFTINTEEGASLTFKVLGSLADEAPNWYATKSTTIRYEHIDILDIEENAEVEGDTGVRVDDTDTNNMYMIYPATALKWITVISENFASGDADVRFRGTE